MNIFSDYYLVLRDKDNNIRRLNYPIQETTLIARERLIKNKQMMENIVSIWVEAHSPQEYFLSKYAIEYNNRHKKLPLKKLKAIFEAAMRGVPLETIKWLYPDLGLDR